MSEPQKVRTFRFIKKIYKALSFCLRDWLKI